MHIISDMSQERAGTTSSPVGGQRQHASRPSGISRHNSENLSLDFSTLPPLITPSPPTNTLLITNLIDPTIFHPASLATIRESISRSHNLYSFSPLKSFRRIIVSLYNTEAAVEVRQQLDGETLLGHRIKVFFGAETPITDADQADRHLAAPGPGKLFFISPPPSPPHGWMMRNEDPPNKDVHADDLSEALTKLKAKTHVADEMDVDVITPISPARTDAADKSAPLSAHWNGPDGRTRSGSLTIVYHPDHHGDSPALPAVMVEDTTGEGDNFGKGEKIIPAHTARPPTELMDH